MINDIRSALPPGIRGIMDSAEAYWQQRTGLRSDEVHELILWIERQAAERNMLRSALVGLVGVDGDKALREMTLGIGFVPMPDAERQTMANAIDALRATLKSEEDAG